MPKLNYHNRYSFSPIVNRPDFSWQDSKRLAFYIGVDVEWFAFNESESVHTPDLLDWANVKSKIL